ncbi:ATP-binding cassette domain-containing protein [Mycetocola tolaasinivorans]|uniref:ATP-binding cassette domain-containing protein n=1 Tax=Mycetocola tolaasinivorans TaxID=76635 RepID=A0A3L7A4S6_9MICO|nr:ATP-binding cassette domain-containing protein [Mycetocola tolaasinivorans]RLP75336.1 ATP-binding cassette domain-containing protein [Mycetocola tolaasinivorans]
MLEIRGINKSFATRQVLTNMSFTIAPGRMTGFVGGNGAGKTTTMRILLGVLGSDSGEVLLNRSPLSEQDRRRIGYMPEERGLYPKMKVAEQITYFARLHGLSADAAKRNTATLLEQLGLGERGGDTIESLSLGNQQRAQIAAALVHDPIALVLDEPFSGLDPLAVDVVLAVLKERAQAGVPVLFSSHQLDIVERLCDDIVIISGGQVRAAGPAQSLRDAHRGNRFSLDGSADAGWVREVPGISVLNFDGGHVEFDADTAERAQLVLRGALERGEVHAFTPVRPSLAQIYREVVQ